MSESPFPSSKLVGFVAAVDAQRAKTFYGITLGLRLMTENQFALVFDANGIPLRVALVQEVTAPQYTVLGWQVPDIHAAAKYLKTAGVTLERYDGLQQDELGVWRSPTGASVAWFKDPDGNVLSISQH